jgi:hypothetical protein
MITIPMDVSDHRTAHFIRKIAIAVIWLATQKGRPRSAPKPDLAGVRGTSARGAIGFYIITTTAAVIPA